MLKFGGSVARRDFVAAAAPTSSNNAQPLSDLSAIKASLIKASLAPYIAGRSIVVQSNGKILIGGDCTRVRGGAQGVQRAYLARLNADGSADTGFDPGSGAIGIVRTLVLQRAGGRRFERA